MEKPGSLRAAIVAYLPELAVNPDQLVMWVDQGRVRTVQGPDLGFAIEYKLTGVIAQFGGHPSIVWLAINQWLAVNQPDLLTALTPGYAFEADIIDNETADLQFELQLDEVVRVTPREGGGHDLQHVIVPAALDQDMADPPAVLKQLWWRGEQILP